MLIWLIYSKVIKFVTKHYHVISIVNCYLLLSVDYAQVMCSTIDIPSNKKLNMMSKIA